MPELYVVDVILRGGIKIVADSEDEARCAILKLEAVQILEIIKESGNVFLDDIEAHKL